MPNGRKGFASFTDRSTGERAFVFASDPEASEESLQRALESAEAGQPTPGFTVLGVEPRPAPEPVEQPGLFQRARGAFVRGGGLALSPFFGREIGETVTRAITPETPTGLAAEAALIGASLIPGAATATGPALAARMAARVAAPTVAGAVTGALTEEDRVAGAIRGAVTGGVASVTEALGPLVRGGTAAVRKFMSRSRVIQEGVQDSIRVSQQIAQEVPGLKKVLPGKRSDLLDVRSPEKGLKALRNQFKATDNAIRKAFKGEKVDITVVSPFPREAEAGGLAFGRERVGIGRAIENLKNLKQAARESLPGPEGFPTREMARRAEEGFRNVLRTKVVTFGGRKRNLLGVYNDTVQDFDKGLDVLQILKDSKAVEETAQGAFLDMGRLARFLNANIEKFPPEKLPRLFATATRGAGVGAADVVRELTLRGFVPRTAAISVPIGFSVERAGAPLARRAFAPGPAQLPVSATAIRAVEEALSPSPFGLE